MTQSVSQVSRSSVGKLAGQIMNRVISHRVTQSGSLPVNAQMVVYHYTNMRGACGIIESGRMRATHIAYMNDSLEYILASQATRSEVERVLKEGKFAGVEELASAMIANLEAANEIERQPPIFIASFSEALDDLSQWRGYGDGEGGIALGFAAKGLLQVSTATPRNTLFLPCIYDTRFQAELISAVVIESIPVYKIAIARDLPTDKEDYVRQFVELLFYWELSSIAALFKSSTFAAEREWRLIHWATQKDIVIAPRGRTLTGYVELPFNSSEGPNFPLVRAFIGPGSYTQHAKFALKTLLVNKGFILDPELSKVAYRVMG